MPRALLLYLLALLICSIALLASLSARAALCDGGIVNPGAYRIEVERRCGSPTLRDAWPEAVVPGYGVVSRTDVWFYNRGGNRLTRLFYFRNGRLDKIRTGGFGYDSMPSFPCDPAVIHPGMNEFDLLFRCGRPAERDRRFDVVLLPGSGPDWRWRAPPMVQPRRVEVWVYDFGDNRFMRFVTVVDGHVAKVQTGGYGAR